MILSDPRKTLAAARIGGRATLDGLLRRSAQRRPDAIALLDPPNRESFTGGPPRRLTYAQADRMVTAIAGRLRRMGLPADAIVGIQTANTVDGVLALLGVLRAGLIAMPLPLLWRQAEAVAALGRVGTSALIVSGRIGTVDHYDLAMQIAAESFPIRAVCGFGEGAPDGLVTFDDLYTADRLDLLPPPDAQRAAPPGPGAHVAVVTWDVSADGPVQVARSHAELIAGGLAVLLESRIPQDAVILTTLAMSSFASLAVALLPWLLVGGTLALHHPFDPASFMAQRRAASPGTIVVPGPLIAPFMASGQLAAGDGLANVIAVWRAPERVAQAPAWRGPGVFMTDVHVFGEAGLVAARRPPTDPAPIPFGVVFAPSGARGAVAAIEIARTPVGTVALRGPMVPHAPFPPGAERGGAPYLKVAASGFVDTGYACLPDTAGMVVTGPPAGTVSVGGYRFVVRDLQDIVGRLEHGGAALAVLPDTLAGHRLAGSAADRNAVCDALAKLGASPLLTAAFRSAA